MRVLIRLFDANIDVHLVRLLAEFNIISESAINREFPLTTLGFLQLHLHHGDRLNSCSWTVL
jgi:hypothetical protein